MTLRALATLRRADVLALPRSNDHGASMAWRIAAPNVGDVPGQERLFLTFPMSKDPERLRPAIELACAAIAERLAAGKSVAFATEGDPGLYSTFIYVGKAVGARLPGVRIEIVPGVSSITAVPAVTGMGLADGQERIAILPGNYGVEDLAEVLAKFDTTVLMKIGPEIPNVIAALEREGLIEKAVYVSKATMAEQRIERDVRAVAAERGDCFAMMIVSRRQRSGVLVGDAPFSQPGFPREVEA
jgi:precorrin-2/cobalt-factor-2 C20-methyltransferase